MTLSLSSSLLLLSILLVLVSVVCVCMCMAGRYCFRLIAAVVVDFSPLLFTHTHTCRSFSFILLPKKTRNVFILHTYVFILILLSSFFFSSSYVITHPFFFICCIPFFPFTRSFSLFLTKRFSFFYPVFSHIYTRSILHAN